MAAGSVHTWRQGRARARWTVDLRTGPRSRLTNPTYLNEKKKNIKTAKSHGVIPKTASRVVLTFSGTALHRRHTDHHLSRVTVPAQGVPGPQTRAEGGQTEAGPGLRPQLGGLRGAWGPESHQGQPERPGANVGLLHVLGLVVALDIPVQVDGPPSHEDVVHRRPLVDNQACCAQKERGILIKGNIS